MHILITGAGGFLARELIRELEGTHTLRLLDRVRPEDATVFVPGSHDRISAPFATDWPFIVGEITDPATVAQAVTGVDAIIHLAAAVSGFAQYGVATFTANALGTFVMLDEARKAGVGRFLCASSINAFGTFAWRINATPIAYATLPLHEDVPAVPQDPYSLSKLVNEETCAAFHRAYGITTAALRFAGLWTTAQYEEARAVGLSPTVNWSDDLFQWVHVLDIARGMRQAVEAPQLPGMGVYTLGAADTRCPEPTLTLLERFRPHLVATRSAPLQGRAPLLAIDHAQAAFGYAPQYRLGA